MQTRRRKVINKGWTIFSLNFTTELDGKRDSEYSNKSEVYGHVYGFSAHFRNLRVREEREKKNEYIHQ